MTPKRLLEWLIFQGIIRILILQRNSNFVRDNNYRENGFDDLVVMPVLICRRLRVRKLYSRKFLKHLLNSVQNNNTWKAEPFKDFFLILCFCFPFPDLILRRNILKHLCAIEHRTSGQLIKGSTAPCAVVTLPKLRRNWQLTRLDSAWTCVIYFYFLDFSSCCSICYPRGGTHTALSEWR